MLDLRCNKNGKKKAINEIHTQEVWVQNPLRCPLVHYALEAKQTQYFMTVKPYI